MNLHEEITLFIEDFIGKEFIFEENNHAGRTKLAKVIDGGIRFFGYIEDLEWKIKCDTENNPADIIEEGYIVALLEYYTDGATETITFTIN